LKVICQKNNFTTFPPPINNLALIGKKQLSDLLQLTNLSWSGKKEHPSLLDANVLPRSKTLNHKSFREGANDSFDLIEGHWVLGRFGI
jgi:hypothetical protein